MKIKITLLVLVLVLPVGALGQSLNESPHAETRLWCPADIENFYLELFANTQREVEPEDSWEIDEDSLYRRGGREYMGDMESMRKTAYHILRTWPEARKGVTEVMAFERKGADRMAMHGYELLVAVWRQIVADRRSLLQTLWGISHILPTEGEVEAAREAAFSRYREKWGGDPGEAPPRHRDSYIEGLAEECDCRWFLAISYKSENFQYKALLVKTGTLFEDWTSENTKTLGFVAIGDQWEMEPAQTNIVFMVKKGETRIQYATYYYLSMDPDPRYASYGGHRDWHFIPIEPLPYTNWGTDPHVLFELECPMWDDDNKAWVWAKAELSSSPGDLWKQVAKELPEGSEKLYLGKDFREWAGPYTPEDQLK